MTKQNRGRHTAFRVVASAIVAAFLLLAFSNGDKIGVKSLPDRLDLISSMPGPDDNASLDVRPVKDTLPHSGAGHTDSLSVQNREVEEEVRILSEEINRMKQYDLQDSLSRLPHVECFMDPEDYRQLMTLIQPEFVERHLRHAESQLRLAEEQQMLAERLKPLLQGHPVLPDTECLRKMAEAQVRLKHLRPMIEGHGRLEHLRPMIDEPFIFPPAVHPYHFDGDCPDMQELQLRIEKELRNPEHQHLWEQGSPGSMEEKDLKMLEKQKEWQEKYRREMDKQRDQMEKTRRQLMDEYHQMMRKYRKEGGNN